MCVVCVWCVKKRQIGRERDGAWENTSASSKRMFFLCDINFGMISGLHVRRAVTMHVWYTCACAKENAKENDGDLDMQDVCLGFEVLQALECIQSKCPPPIFSWS